MARGSSASSLGSTSSLLPARSCENQKVCRSERLLFKRLPELQFNHGCRYSDCCVATEGRCSHRTEQGSAATKRSGEVEQVGQSDQQPPINHNFNYSALRFPRSRTDATPLPHISDFSDLVFRIYSADAENLKVLGDQL